MASKDIKTINMEGVFYFEGDVPLLPKSIIYICEKSQVVVFCDISFCANTCYSSYKTYQQIRLYKKNGFAIPGYYIFIRPSKRKNVGEVNEDELTKIYTEMGRFVMDNIILKAPSAYEQYINDGKTIPERFRHSKRTKRKTPLFETKEVILIIAVIILITLLFIFVCRHFFEILCFFAFIPVFLL